MQLLKSLFCLQGFDNRARYFSIYSAVFILFIILTAASYNNFFIAIIVVAALSLLIGLTSLRRLHDAKLNKNWLFAPSVSFAITALVIIFSGHYASYYLLIIPALCASVLLTYPSIEQRNKEYILGYIGPVDLSEYQQSVYQGKNTKFRIEPSIVAEHSVNIESHEHKRPQACNADNLTASHQTTPIHSHNVDVGELIRLQILGNKKAQIIIVSLMILVSAIVCTSWLINLFTTAIDNNGVDQTNQQNQFSSTENFRVHPVDMPDNFTLFLSQHQGVIINWQADEVSANALWSQHSAQGDESCKYISFNKGKPIRPLSVEVEQLHGTNNNYFAYFSPLDSQTLVQALAFRGKFTLCGYNFSLKGSQAALGKNAHYANWLSY